MKTYLTSPQGYWCGWIDDKALYTLRGEYDKPSFHAVGLYGCEEEAEMRLSVLRSMKLDEGYEEKEAPPVSPSAMLRDPGVCARQEYFLAFTPVKGLKKEDIEAVSEEITSFFFEPEVFNATGIRCEKAHEGAFHFTVSGEVDTLDGGFVPPQVWDGINPERQRLYLSGDQGVNGFLNPKGRGGCAIYTGLRMVDFALRLFITRLIARVGSDEVVVSDQRGSAFEESLFDVECVKEAEWYPVYDSILAPAMCDRGWMKMTPSQAFARAEKKGLLPPKLAWG